MDGVRWELPLVLARDDQNTDIRPKLFDVAGKFMALHTGHANIGDQEVNVAGVLARKVECLAPVDSLENRITEWFQGAHRLLPNDRIILRHKNAFFSHHIVRRGWRSFVTPEKKRAQSFSPADDLLNQISMVVLKLGGALIYSPADCGKRMSVILARMSKHRIVLIEDSDSDIWLLQKCLGSVATNYEIIILKDGEAALEFIEQERAGLEPRPCVIVLDLHLPGHDGLELLAAIRRVPALKHVTALIVSSFPSARVREEIRELGVAYAEKPQTLNGYEALAAQVWELCESMLKVTA
jgi:CheY-like chemotaxis protein